MTEVWCVRVFHSFPLFLAQMFSPLFLADVKSVPQNLERCTLRCRREVHLRSSQLSLVLTLRTANQVRWKKNAFKHRHYLRLELK